MRGQYVEPITDDLKEKFLDLIASGYTRPEAAAALDASARQFRALCNPQSHRYDEDFARAYAQLTEKGGEHHSALVERLRAATLERGLRSSDRLLEKLNVIYDPDWEVHRPQAMQINFRADQMAVMLPELSTETLERMRQEIEEKKRGRELGPPPDIDADAK